LITCGFLPEIRQLAELLLASQEGL